MTLQIKTDDELLAYPQKWLLDTVGERGYLEFKNQWPQISSTTKIEIKTEPTRKRSFYGVGCRPAQCQYVQELDTLIITR